MTSPNIFIVAAARTPFGAFGGALKHVTAVELAVAATQSALQQVSDKIEVDQHVQSIFMGNVIQSGPDASYLARHVGLKSGLSHYSTALTVNRLCGSGMESLLQAYNFCNNNNNNNDDKPCLALAGGVESMSRAPLQTVEARWGGLPLGAGLRLSDTLWDGLTDSHIQTPMGVTAENLARQFGISRDECDAYAYESQQRWKAAHEQGVFDRELAVMDVGKNNKKNKNTLFSVDQHPRPDSTLAQLAQLRPVFEQDGVVTAANASGIADGAGSLLVANHAAVQAYDLRPLARVASYSVTGCDPRIMGIGPVSALQQALALAGLDPTSIDTSLARLEINEAFASQVLACARDLGLSPDFVQTKLNRHGGAIALGHPLGASGSRILAHLVHTSWPDSSSIRAAPSDHERYVAGAACIGGGQGIAVVLERV